MIYILKLIAFSLFINWSISLQILNSTTLNGRDKKVAIVLAIVFAIVAGVFIV